MLRRRDIFPLAGLTAVAPLTLGGQPAQALEYDSATYGLQLRLRWSDSHQCWCVPVVDWDAMSENRRKYGEEFAYQDYRPNRPPLFKDIPLDEFMRELSERLELPVHTSSQRELKIG